MSDTREKHCMLPRTNWKNLKFINYINKYWKITKRSKYTEFRRLQLLVAGVLHSSDPLALSQQLRSHVRPIPCRYIIVETEPKMFCVPEWSQKFYNILNYSFTNYSGQPIFFILYACVYYIYTYLYIYIHTYIYIHYHTYIYIYIYIYIWLPPMLNNLSKTMSVMSATESKVVTRVCF